MGPDETTERPRERITRSQLFVAGAAVIVTVALAAVIAPWSGAPTEDTAVAPETTSRPTARPTLPPPVIAELPSDLPSVTVHTPLPSMAPEPTLPPQGWTKSFVSKQFRYAIRYPSGWLPVRSTKPYEADTFTSDTDGTSTRLSILRRPRPTGMRFEDEVKHWLRSHQAPSGGCRFGGHGLLYTPGGDVFHEIAIDERRALVRSECSVVDGAVDLGGEALLIVLRSERPMPTGDREMFDRFIWTLSIAASAHGRLPTPHPDIPVSPLGPDPQRNSRLTSPRFGYSLLYPASWTASEYPGPAGSDVYVTPDGSRRLEIRAVAIEPGVELDSWALGHI